MKTYILFFLLSSAAAFSAPDCTIDFVRVTSPVGIISGTAKGDKPGSLYVTVKNADLPYTTLADQNGKWSVTFRYFSTQVTAEAWQPGSRNSSATALRTILKEEME